MSAGRWGPLLWLVLTAAGCGSTSARDDLAARLVQLEVQLGALERRVDEPAAVLKRVEALEAALALPPPGIPADVEARLAALEAQVAELLARRGEPAGPPPAQPETRPGAGPVTIPAAPPGSARPVPAGPVEVLSVGGGALLLARTPSGLARVHLLGIEAPERAEVYAERPDLRARHAEAFGAQAVTDDAAFEASRAHLEALVKGPVTLTRPSADAPPGSYDARVALPDGTELDLNAAMVRDGYALPRQGGPRAAELEALAAEARAERRGLFARP